MKKIFVSQPMNGKTKEEILFERRVAMDKIEQTFSFLTEEGYEIIDSYFEDYNPKKGCVPLKYLAKSLELLAEADVAVFIGDWSKYRGCKIEYDCAKAYSITILDVGSSIVDQQDKLEALKQEIYLLEKEIQNERDRLFVPGNYIAFTTSQYKDMTVYMCIDKLDSGKIYGRTICDKGNGKLSISKEDWYELDCILCCEAIYTMKRLRKRILAKIY